MEWQLACIAEVYRLDTDLASKLLTLTCMYISTGAVADVLVISRATGARFWRFSCYHRPLLSCYACLCMHPTRNSTASSRTFREAQRQQHHMHVPLPRQLYTCPSSRPSLLAQFGLGIFF